MLWSSPKPTNREAAVVEGIDVFAVGIFLRPSTSTMCRNRSRRCGQGAVKRALEGACLGGHNIIFIVPPGAGKTMLAKRILSILPPMSLEEAIETTRVHSVAGLLDDSRSVAGTRPFRAPHRTIRDAGLIGGGTIPRPGEVSLGHYGLLFLDELPEFEGNVLGVIRQPLQDETVTISRAENSALRLENLRPTDRPPRPFRAPQRPHPESRSRDRRSGRLGKSRNAPSRRSHPEPNP